MKYSDVFLLISFLVGSLCRAQDQTTGGDVRLPLGTYNQLVTQAADPVVPPRAAPSAYAIGKADIVVTVSERASVDLQRCRVTAPDGDEVAFTVDRRRREALLQGLDEITLTLRREPEIAAFQAADRARRPWVYL